MTWDWGVRLYFHLLGGWRTEILCYLYLFARVREEREVGTPVKLFVSIRLRKILSVQSKGKQKKKITKPAASTVLQIELE